MGMRPLQIFQAKHWQEEGQDVVCSESMSKTFCDLYDFTKFISSKFQWTYASSFESRFLSHTSSISHILLISIKKKWIPQIWILILDRVRTRGTLVGHQDDRRDILATDSLALNSHRLS